MTHDTLILQDPKGETYVLQYDPDDLSLLQLYKWFRECGMSHEAAEAALRKFFTS
jgi:DNA-binding transcriptional MerR regulator